VVTAGEVERYEKEGGAWIQNQVLKQWGKMVM